MRASTRARTLLVPPLAVGSLWGVLLFWDSWNAQRSLGTEELDLSQIYAGHPAWLPAVAAIAFLAFLHVVLVLPVLRRVPARLSARMLAAFCLAILVSQLFAVFFYAPEVDTWAEVSVAMLAVFGLPVFMLALVASVMLRQPAHAP